MQPLMISIPAERLGLFPRANLEDPRAGDAARGTLTGSTGVAPESVAQSLRRQEEQPYEQARSLALSWLRGECQLSPGALAVLCQLGAGREAPDDVLVVRDVTRVSAARTEFLRLQQGEGGVREGPPFDLFAMTGSREYFNLRGLVAGLRQLDIWARAIIHPHADDAAGIQWRLFYRDPRDPVARTRVNAAS